jgi:broad specificity phosphatase PhoE
MQLTIIKHGKTDYNIAGKRQGRTDLSLNEEGTKGVQELKENVGDDFDFVISSPLKRALETVQILFPNKDITTNDLLIEYDFGELEGVEFSKPLTDFPNNEVEEYNGIKFLMPKSGESFENVTKRCEDFLESLKKDYKDSDKLAIVTHSTNLEILKALIENKPWHTYLGQAKQFHGMIVAKI